MWQIGHNITPRTEKPKHIVVHCTGNPRKGANAGAHFNYWNSGYVGQSADFVVDDKEALQINDYTKYFTWHCGDGKGKNGITNGNSIGVEICINEDGDFSKAVSNAVALIRKLKSTTGIESVVRHYDASGKICPAEFYDGGTWEGWKEFLKRVNSAEELTTPNDIVWELSHRGIVLDAKGMLDEMNEHPNGRLYWLARKMLQYIRERE